MREGSWERMEEEGMKRGRRRKKREVEGMRLGKGEVRKREEEGGGREGEDEEGGKQWEGVG